MTESTDECPTPPPAQIGDSSWKDPNNWGCVKHNKKIFLVSEPLSPEEAEQVQEKLEKINDRSIALASRAGAADQIDGGQLENAATMATCAHLVPSRRQKGAYVILLDCEAATSLPTVFKSLGLPETFEPTPVSDQPLRNQLLSEIQGRPIPGFRSWDEVLLASPRPSNWSLST